LNWGPFAYKIDQTNDAVQTDQQKTVCKENPRRLYRKNAFFSLKSIFRQILVVSTTSGTTNALYKAKCMPGKARV
jgi:hypothetical protein